MMTSAETYDLIIVGGGPVGLLSGILAHHSGLRTLVLEKNSEPLRHSRSIGIHPPSLNILDQAGVISGFMDHGMIIRRGLACSDHQSALGELSFRELVPPCNFILTIPQWKTESLLEQNLYKLNPGMLRRGIEVTDIRFRSGFKPPSENRKTSENPPVQVIVSSLSGHTGSLYGRMVMACDGKKSLIRRLAGVPFRGGPYTARYAMGDFTDRTGYGSDAIIFLSKQGLVECFPLPDGVRRWVVQQVDNHILTELRPFTDTIGQRCGIQPDIGECYMFSEFGTERFLADTFWDNGILLAGDSAHVVSPIGGQGMNLGWMNAAEAIPLIRKVCNYETHPADAANRYNRIARKRAKKVIRRAELNMAVGNRNHFPDVRNHLVKAILHSPLKNLLRTRFTMQGL